MASKKPAKKRTARKAQNKRDDVVVAQWNFGPSHGRDGFIAELLEKLASAPVAEEALPAGSHWVCAKAGEPNSVPKSEPIVVPEIHGRLSALASGQDRLQGAIKALIDRLQCVMTKQPEPKPASVSSAASDVGSKIEVASIRAHEAADLIESLTDCLGV